MAGLKIEGFGGVIPRLGARLLPNNGAQIAQNAKLFSGELRSWFQATLINTPTKGGNLQSMFRMYTTGTGAADFWLSWTDDVDAVRGPIAGDTAFKIYYTGDSTGIGGPKKTNLVLSTASGTDYPHDYLEMGVPAPGSAPTIIGTGGTSTVSLTRIYAYTYVTSTASWAEERSAKSNGHGHRKVRRDLGHRRALDRDHREIRLRRRDQARLPHPDRQRGQYELPACAGQCADRDDQH